MFFALFGVIIILISLFASSYYLRLESKKSENVLDIGNIREFKRNIERIEKELNSAAIDAGYEAVEEVKKEISNEQFSLEKGYLKRIIGERTNQIFEIYFEENYKEKMEDRYGNIELTLRPLTEKKQSIDWNSFYIEEKSGEDGWKKVPGSFQIQRVIDISSKKHQIDTSFRDSIEINAEVRTDIFILAERLDEFDFSSGRKLLDNMVTSYANLKMLTEEDISYSTDFEGNFEIDWEEVMKNGLIDFSEGEERKNPLFTNSTNFINSFERDIGNVDLDKLISEEDILHLAKTAFILEQIRVFGDYDEGLLSSISEFFQISEKRLNTALGYEKNDFVNVQNLVLRLFSEKELGSEEMFFPKLFLRSNYGENFLSIIDEEDWTENGFILLKNLISGNVKEEEAWEYQDFQDNIIETKHLPHDSSHIRALINEYGRSMDNTLKSFNTDSEEVKELTMSKISEKDPISWTGNLEMIGEDGNEKIRESILYQAGLLSESFGFESKDVEEIGYPFYYIYYICDWGQEKTDGELIEPEDQFDDEAVYRLLKDKVENELSNRMEILEGEKNSLFDEVMEKVDNIGETEWYESTDEVEESWNLLNETSDIILELKKNGLFSNEEIYNTTEELDNTYPELKENIDEVRELLNDLPKNGSDYVESILESAKQFPQTKWNYEAMNFLLTLRDAEEKDFLNSTDQYLGADSDELTGEYQWELADYSLKEDIEIPPENLDQSIGYKAIGHHVEDTKRGFKAPLQHENSNAFFDLVNQNLYDLSTPREGREKSRLEYLLFNGEDPFSDTLSAEDLPDLRFDLDKINAVSDEYEEIKESWLISSSKETREKLNEIERSLDNKFEELNSIDARDEPYQKYKDAGFYGMASDAIEIINKDIEKFEDRKENMEDFFGYPESEKEAFKGRPVITTSEGRVKLTDSPNREDRTFLTEIKFDIELNTNDDIFQVEETNHDTVRLTGSENSDMKEWVNPHSVEENDFYSSVFEFEIEQAEYELELDINENYRFISEIYSTESLIKIQSSKEHRCVGRTISPVPLLNEGYSPYSRDVKMEKVTFDRNVINHSEREIELSGEIKDMDEKDIFIEVMRRDDLHSLSGPARSISTGNYGVTGDSSENNLDIVASNIVHEENIEDGNFNISFTIDESILPQKRHRKEHLIVRVHSEVEPKLMQHSLSLQQSHKENDNNYYSFVPIYSNTNQIFLKGEDQPSSIGAFRVDKENLVEGVSEHSFDLIENIPENSWIIEKHNQNYLVDFSEHPNWKKSLSGEFERNMFGKNRYQEKFRVDLDEKMERFTKEKVPIEDQNPYIYLYKNEFLPIYMRWGEENNDLNLFPERAIAIQEEEKNKVWQLLSDISNDLSRQMKIERRRNLAFSYNLEEFDNPSRVNKSIEQIRLKLENLPSIDLTNLYITESETKNYLQDMVLEETNENKEDDLRNIFVRSVLSSEKEEKIDELTEEYEYFSPISVAHCMDIFEEKEVERVLEWTSLNREYPNKELRAFLALDSEFLKNLTVEMEKESLEEAINKLDQKIEKKNFYEYNELSIRDLNDLKQWKSLRERFDEELLSKSASIGLEPTTLAVLDEKYDLEGTIESIDSFSNRLYFEDFIEEINSENERLIGSVVFLKDVDQEILELKQLEDQEVYLSVNGKLIESESLYVNEIDLLEEKIGEFIETKVEESNKELKHRLTISFRVGSNVTANEEDIKRLRKQVIEVSQRHDPYYQHLYSIEIRSRDSSEVVFRYHHL